MYNHQLDTFIKAAQSGSFSKAANELFISPSAVIQQISLLENNCGCKLFLRHKTGVTLTESGKSLLEDAKAIIKLSNEAKHRAEKLDKTQDNTIRVGTNLLYKCRLLPDLWSKAIEKQPDLKIEICSMQKYDRAVFPDFDSDIGFDIFEGIYATEWSERCSFYELMKTPICCAVNKNHEFANLSLIRFSDFKNQTVVIPVKGLSRQFDEARSRLTALGSVRIIDSSYYDIDTFALCELNNYVLITQLVFKDVHTNLKTIPLEEEIYLPYGLIYTKTPSPVLSEFLDIIREL